MGNCGKMDPELPENSYEMVPDKEERKDEEVEWYSLLCNVFIIPHVSYITHQTAWLKILEETVSYALQYCMLYYDSSQTQSPMPTSIKTGQQ